MQENQLDELQEKVRHGDFMLPFAQYVTWIPGSFTVFPMHWHKEVEIIYVQTGTCEINVDLKNYVITEGDIVVVRPYALHSIKQHGIDNGCLFSWVFDVNMLTYGATDACYVNYIKPFIDGKLEGSQIINVIEPSYGMIKEVLMELHRVCDARESVMEFDIKWHLEKLFFLLFRDVFQKKGDSKEQKSHAIHNIKIVLDYIQENYQNTLTIKELAGLLHFSEPYFMRFFKKHTGMTCVDYINDYRMAKAVELLQNKSLSVMEVSLLVGMHNISYFNRIFKKKYQMTPREYRKKCISGQSG